MEEQGKTRGSAAPMYFDSFHTAIKTLQDIGLKKHMMKLRMTPFRHIFELINDDKINPKACQKGGKYTAQIMCCYDSEKDMFIIGGQEMKITEEQVRLIFGIVDGPYAISCFKKDAGSKFFDRFFSKEDRPRSLGISLLVQLLKDARIGSSDFACVATLYLLAMVFAPVSSKTIAKWSAEYVSDIRNMCRYNWSGFILHSLMKSIQDKERKRHTGCFVLLSYWFCEHCKIVKPFLDDAYPRFMRWDLQNLKEALKKTSVHDITPNLMKKFDGKTDNEAAFLNQPQEEYLSTSEGEDGEPTDDSVILISSDSGEEEGSYSEDDGNNLGDAPCTSVNDICPNQRPQEEEYLSRSKGEDDLVILISDSGEEEGSCSEDDGNNLDDAPCTSVNDICPNQSKKTNGEGMDIEGLMEELQALCEKYSIPLKKLAKLIMEKENHVVATGNGKSQGIKHAQNHIRHLRERLEHITDKVGNIM